MAAKHIRRRVMLLVILLALLALLTAFTAVFHDDESCSHGHCLLCAFLHHKNDALQPLTAANAAIFGTFVLFFGIRARTKAVLFTPVCLKVRMDR